jgi:pimeloyl-ACP methyl ester carboxylesterase
MRTFRRVMAVALVLGILSFLIVPFLIPVESSGTLTIEEAAGSGAEFVEVDGVAVHVERVPYAGELVVVDAEPPLIVLLHGFGASTFTWREIIEPLSGFGDVIAYDRPAFGFTERPETVDAYGPEANFAILDALVEASGPDREVIVVGHSAGGGLAAEYARTRPDTVDELILLSPAISSGGGGIPAWVVPLLGIPQIDRLGPLLAGALASGSTGLLDRSFYDTSAITDEIRDGYFAPLEVDGWERGFWNFVRAPRISGLADRLDEIRQPTLVITGDTDTVVETAASERLASELPDADLVVIPRSGHLAHEETPEPVMAAMAEWLTRD